MIDAKAGAVALDLATSHAGPIDLVLTDVVMPLMSGLDLWERLAPSLPLATVLFMSGHPRHAVARRLATEGAAFLQKVRAVLDARRRQSATSRRPSQAGVTAALTTLTFPLHPPEDFCRQQFDLPRE